MSIVIRGDRQTGSVGKDTRINETWYVYEENDRDQAIAALFADVPPINGGLLTVGITYENYSPDGWEFQVQWGADGTPEEGELKISVETEEVMVKMFQSLGEKASVVAPGEVDVPSYGVIGMSEDGEMEGAEIPVTKGSARIEVFQQSAIFTDAYAKAILKLKNVVNNAPWKIFDAGELRLKKAYFEQTRKRDASGRNTLQRMVMDFDYEETVTGLVVAGLPAFTIKWGHDLLKIRHKSEVATVAGKKVKVMTFSDRHCLSIV